jgi:hypothetical protein
MNLLCFTHPYREVTRFALSSQLSIDNFDCQWIPMSTFPRVADDFLLHLSLMGVLSTSMPTAHECICRIFRQTPNGEFVPKFTEYIFYQESSLKYDALSETKSMYCCKFVVSLNLLNCLRMGAENMALRLCEIFLGARLPWRIGVHRAYLRGECKLLL